MLKLCMVSSSSSSSCSRFSSSCAFLFFEYFLRSLRTSASRALVLFQKCGYLVQFLGVVLAVERLNFVLIRLYQSMELLTV